MDLNEALFFTKVVDAGSFTAAAQALGVPKSTVSRKVADLEARLGCRLLQRTTRKLSLTDAGRTFHLHAGRAMADLEAAERAVTALDETPRGRLRVSAPPNLQFLGPACAAFLDAHPDVQLDVASTDRVVDLIDEGYDLALRAGTLQDSSLVARRITAWASILVASPAYLDRAGTPQTPDDLAEHAGLEFGTSTMPARWTLQRGKKVAHVRPTPRLVTNEFDAIEDAVAAGLGVAMVPVFRCTADVEARRLVRILPDWSSPAVPLHAVYPTRQHLPARVKAFVDFMVTHLADRDWTA